MIDQILILAKEISRFAVLLSRACVSNMKYEEIWRYLAKENLIFGSFLSRYNIGWPDWGYKLLWAGAAGGKQCRIETRLVRNVSGSQHTNQPSLHSASWAAITWVPLPKSKILTALQWKARSNGAEILLYTKTAKPTAHFANGSEFAMWYCFHPTCPRSKMHHTFQMSGRPELRKLKVYKNEQKSLTIFVWHNM